MDRPNNYTAQIPKAQQRFLTYNQTAIIQKFHLLHDENYLYPRLLGRCYRLCRNTAALERETEDGWIIAESFNEVFTLFDLLCDSRVDRSLSGRWCSTQSLGQHIHQNLTVLPDDPIAQAIDKNPSLLHTRCRLFGGKPIPGADIGYAMELFDGLCIGVRFWHSDEDFPAQLQYVWDENALQYLRYETLYYAIGLLVSLLFPIGVL